MMMMMMMIIIIVIIIIIIIIIIIAVKLANSRKRIQLFKLFDFSKIKTNYILYIQVTHHTSVYHVDIKH